MIQVIETKALKGDGTTEDPCRFIYQYWDFDGELLAEKDEYKKMNARETFFNESNEIHVRTYINQDIPEWKGA